MRGIVKTRGLGRLRPFKRVLPYFFRGNVGVVICFYHVQSYHLGGRAKGAEVAVRDPVVNVTFLTRLCVNGFFRLRRFTVVQEPSRGFPGLFQDGRAPFVLRYVLVDFVEIFSR